MTRKRGLDSSQLPKCITFRAFVACAAVVIIATGGGCAGTKWIKARGRPALPIVADLSLDTWRGPRPTPRTKQHLRRHDLVSRFGKQPDAILDQLIADDHPHLATPEHVLAVSEVAFIAGHEALDGGDYGDALDAFGLSVAYAYRYLLSPEFDGSRNPYDPQFRQASDLYNGALENMMRIVQRQGQLRPGAVHVARTNSKEYEFHIQCRGPWRPEEIKDLRFVSDYEIQGLKNHYRTYGLGVPLIAIHSRDSGTTPAEAYYAPGMTVPVTAFVRVLPASTPSPSKGCTRHVCVVELHDSLQFDHVMVDQQRIPLETDLTTPLAYGLNDPAFKKANTATQGLLNPNKSQRHQGLYLLEPYDPTKTPVLMIHGLWSDLVTWMEMFNDLRGEPEIRSQFQFWFYLYPSGQPLLLTAMQLRDDLRAARETIDPDFSNPSLNQAVLVGHSMGGLVARLQTMHSDDDYWQLVSGLPADEMPGDEAAADVLRKATVFEPNPFISRVVTIAAPHHGSAFSNNATRWLGRKLINLPEMLDRTREQLSANRDLIPEQGGFEIQTSIDSLSPASPVLEIMQRTASAPWVRHHNIIGVIAEKGVLSKMAGDSDGVVTVESGRSPHAVSELIVNSDHVNIHRHPRTVLELQRILLTHASEMKRTAIRRLPPTIKR